MIGFSLKAFSSYIKYSLIGSVLWFFCCNPIQAQYTNIEPDEIPKCIVEIGGGLGADYIILWGTVNANINVYPIQFKYFKASINNEVGIMLPWARILYYYPSAQVHFLIKDKWVLLGLGREYTQVTTGIDQFNRTIDYRFDIGMKFYPDKNRTITFTIPLRFDDEIPVYFTGANVKLNFRW